MGSRSAEVVSSHIDEKFAIGRNRVPHTTHDPALWAESSVILIPPYLPLDTPKLVLYSQLYRSNAPALPVLSKMKLRFDVPTRHSRSIRSESIPCHTANIAAPACPDLPYNYALTILTDVLV